MVLCPKICLKSRFYPQNRALQTFLFPNCRFGKLPPTWLDIALHSTQRPVPLELSFLSSTPLTLASSLLSSLLHSCGQSHEDHCWHTCWSYIDFREGRKLSNSACFGVLSNPKQTASVTLISHLQNCANVWQGKKMENPEQSTCCLIFHPQQYYYQHSCWEFDDFLQLQQWPEYQPVNASIFKTSKHIQPFTWSKWKYEGDDGFYILELKVGS